MNIIHDACMCEEMVDRTDKKLLDFGKIRLSTMLDQLMTGMINLAKLSNTVLIISILTETVKNLFVFSG